VKEYIRVKGHKNAKHALTLTKTTAGKRSGAFLHVPLKLKRAENENED
jgi:hypothetical protein